MRTVAIKRVYDKPAPGDGTRILVDRLWPRGLSKAKAKLDGWEKEAAPSPALRKWFDHRADRFTEFKRRYRAELKANPALARIKAVTGKVTLLYGARDPKINHAIVLAAALKAK